VVLLLHQTSQSPDGTWLNAASIMLRLTWTRPLVAAHQTLLKCPRGDKSIQDRITHTHFACLLILFCLNLHVYTANYIPTYARTYLVVHSS
jgi:hypothetical protein